MKQTSVVAIESTVKLDFACLHSHLSLRFILFLVEMHLKLSSYIFLPEIMIFSRSTVSFIKDIVVEMIIKA